jgi:hypothetical protein
MLSNVSVPYEFSNYTLTYLSTFIGVEGFGTFITTEHAVRVAKASSGHFPLPFLISFKRTGRKDISGRAKPPKNFYPCKKVLQKITKIFSYFIHKLPIFTRLILWQKRASRKKARQKNL